METLTKEEKKQLEDSGYSKADIQQITAAIKKTEYFLVTPTGQRLIIPQSEAIERLGRKEWLRAIAKSTFFVNTTRYGLNNERIALHSIVYA